MAMVVQNYFESFQKMLSNSISQQQLPNLRSIYVIGSFACGVVERKYSDIDLYIVIEANGVSERIATIRQVDEFINPLLRQYISNLYGIHDQDLPNYHPHHYFTRDEFVRYCTLYPTRVLYPLLRGDWKLAYGVNCLSNVSLPSRSTCVEYLQYDFDGIIEFFQELQFNGDGRTLVKYFYRALKKAAWILFDIYVPSYLNIPTLKSLFEPLYPNVAAVIASTESFADKGYKMDGLQYFSLYVRINECYEQLGGEIKKYVLKNGYTLMDKSVFYRREFWGTFFIEFEELVRKFVSEEKPEDRYDIITSDYRNLMSLICYTLFYDFPLESIYLPSDRIPPKRSRILDTEHINMTQIHYLQQEKDFLFLVDTHLRYIQETDLKSIPSEELDKYIEYKYLPAVQGVLSAIVKIKHMAV